MIRHTFVASALVAAAAAACPADAATLATWPSSAGSSHAGSAVAPNLTTIALTRGPGLSVNSGGTFNSRNWTQGGNLGTAMTNGTYLEFGVTLAPDYQADFTQFSTTLDRSGTGPRTMHLVVSDDGYATFSDLGAVTLPSESPVSGTFDFDLQDLSGTIVFRLYGYGATGAAGTFDPESTLILSGSEPELVPEPASLALLTAGGVLIAQRRRRHAA